jgi:hypothetical protein
MLDMGVMADPTKIGNVGVIVEYLADALSEYGALASVET